MDYTDIQIVECNKKQSVAGTDIHSENAINTEHQNDWYRKTQ